MDLIAKTVKFISVNGLNISNTELHKIFDGTKILIFIGSQINYKGKTPITKEDYHLRVTSTDPPPIFSNSEIQNYIINANTNLDVEGQATIRNEKQVLVSNEQLEQLEQLRNEGNYETVIQICDNILKREPNNTDMLNEKAISLQYLERYSESIQCLDIAIQIEPTEQLFYNKGRALMSLEKFEESIECFNKVIKFNPKHASAWHSISFGLYHLQRFSEAIVYENQAIEINPNEPAFWLGKGHSLSYLDKPEESEQCFAKAKELEEKE